MNQKKPADLLRQIATDYDGVSQELFQAAQLIDQNTRYNLQNKLLSLVRISEVSTVKLRDVSSRMVEMDAGMFYDEIVNILGIDVKEYDHWIKIRVPAVLPNRNARDSQAFLIRPLRHALVDFQRRTPIERFGACAICIVHSYDEALGCRRVRDYDNIETKRYLDVIESVFLTNDSGLLCTVLQTTTMSDRDETSFYLMLPETLPIWVKEHIKTRTKIR
jgi:hypothetical protein